MKADTNLLKQKALDHLWMPYTQWNDMAAEGGPTIMVEAAGCRVTDSEGKTYLDGISALEAAVAGHRNMQIIDAAYEQMKQMEFLDVFRYASVPAIELAEKLADIAPGDLSKVHFTPGGSEAVETAIKMARQYHYLNGDQRRYKVIGRKGAYHGCTYGAMLVDGHIGLTKTHHFEPLVPGGIFAPPPYFYRCEFGSKTPQECAQRAAQAVEEIILFERPETIAAVVVDPATTYQGVAVPHEDYLPMVRDICSRYGVLLIADEIITGFGRTGKMFCVEHTGVVPDIMTVSKGLTSGYMPQGAAIASTRIADMFIGGSEQTFAHGQTYGAHPAACAVALKNIEIIERDRLADRAAEMGGYLLEGLNSLRHHRTVGDVRGIGLLCGVEMVKDKETKETFEPRGMIGRQLRLKCRELGLITLPLYPGDSMLFAPPLIITKEEIDELVSIFDKAITEIETKYLGR